MPLKSADSLAPENVPDLALEVIVASKKQSTRHGESDRGDTTNGLADRVSLQLSVRTNVKQPAGCIIRASTKRVAVREELNSVDVGVVSSKRLRALLLSEIGRAHV